MQKFSPNWYWDQLGYRVVRYGYRTIFDNQSRVVIDRSRYKSVNDYYMLELSMARWLYESLTENPDYEMNVLCPKT